MDNQEKYIHEKIGDANPFRVPEGYFDLLATRVMEQLPERNEAGQAADIPHSAAPKGRGRSVALRPWLYAAASLLVLAVLTGTFLSRQSAATGEQVAGATVVAAPIDNGYIDEAADYAMIDNEEIYLYLADN